MKSSLLLLPLLLLLSACDVSTTSAAGLPLENGRHYRIQQGDTLYSIAARAYGDPLKWLLIQDKNPWLVDPESLQIGDPVYIPEDPGGRSVLNVEPGLSFAQRRQAKPTPAAPAPAAETSLRGRLGSFRRILNLQGAGQSVERLGIFALIGMVLHAFVQGFLLWLVATVSFVKDVSLKKAMRTSFHTELVTVFAIFVLGSVVLVLLHLSATEPGQSGSTLMATVQNHLRNPTSLGIAALGSFGLYLLLCLRFIPAAFELERVRSSAIILLAVLGPHLLILFAVGQHLNLIEL